MNIALRVVNKLWAQSYYLYKSIARVFPGSSPCDALSKLWLSNESIRISDARISVPAGERSSSENVILRWFNTLWCNNSCHYCDQPHRRDKDNHSFDIYPVDKWINSFDRHFLETNRRLLLVLTGGEPMLDVRNMKAFLVQIGSRGYLQNIRIDTNLSWALDAYDGVSQDKIWLMCTYHPTQIDEAHFISKVIQAQNHGYNIGMVNYVLTSESSERYDAVREKLLKFNIPLHPNPLWDSNGVYDNESLQILRRFLPPKDYLYRTGLSTTFQKSCLFPAIGYEMDQHGNIDVGCHRSRLFRGDFVNDAKLPRLFKSYTTCPQKHCKCLDKYSFLYGFDRNYDLNPLCSYKRQLLERNYLVADSFM